MTLIPYKDVNLNSQNDYYDDDNEHGRVNPIRRLYSCGCVPGKREYLFNTLALDLRFGVWANPTITTTPSPALLLRLRNLRGLARGLI